MVHKGKAIIAVGMIVAAALLLLRFMSSKRVMSETEQAIELVHELLDKPENQDAPYPSGFPRGPRDHKPDYWKGEKDNAKLTREQVQDAKDLTRAILSGNLRGVQDVLERHDGKPYALTQLASHVSYIFHQAGIPFELHNHPAGRHLYLNRSRTSTPYGNLSLSFTFGRLPGARISVKPEGANDGVWQDVFTDAVTPEVLMSSFGSEATAAALFRKSIKKDESK